MLRARTFDVRASQGGQIVVVRAAIGRVVIATCPDLRL